MKQLSLINFALVAATGGTGGGGVQTINGEKPDSHGNINVAVMTPSQEEGLNRALQLEGRVSDVERNVAEIEGAGFITDAPEGGKEYVRKHGEWVEGGAASAPTIVSEEYDDDGNTICTWSDGHVTTIKRGQKGDSVTMFPAVTIFGHPRIQETQMSEFTASNYAQFPFLVDFAGRHWQLDCAITTGADVSQQHNVFDSAFGLAFAFSGGKFVLAMSSNGTSWNLGATSGTHSILANTTYYIRITWDGANYVLAYSTNKVDWTNDITVASTESLASKQIIIGKSLDNAHIFNGSINFADARLTIANVIVWEGMGEVGTATRMALDMSNIDDAGKQRVNDIVKAGSFGEEVTELDRNVGTLSTDVAGKVSKPASEGTSGQVLTTDGQGGTSWTTPECGGGIPDAPADGKTYGRKNGGWAEVTGGGGSTPIDTTLDPATADNEHAAGAKTTADKLSEINQTLGYANNKLETIIG